MMIIPIPIVIEDLGYVGSSVFDFLIDLSVSVFDIINGAGSSGFLSSVPASS